MDKNLNYNAEQIRTAEGREHVRMRPSMYIGSTANPNHLVIEIMANSIDEAMNGYGKEIIFTLSKDASEISVQDFGRGIPVNALRDDGLTTLEASFSVLNTSGKFDQNAFQTSIGTNGIGGKAANFLSKDFKVKSVRDGEYEELVFSQGVLQNRVVKKTKEPNGVFVWFKPDSEIFSSTKFDTKMLKETLKQASYLNKGVTLKLIDDKGAEHTFHSQNGLKDYMNDLANKDHAIKVPLYIAHAEQGRSVEVALTYTNGYNEVTKTFANTGYTPDGGTHLTALRTVLTRQLNTFALDSGLIKSADKNLSGKEYSEGLIIVMNINMADLGYEGQTKSKVTDTRVAPFVNPILAEHIKDWLDANPKDAKVIIEKALETRRANEAAKKAREKARQPKKETLKQKLELNSKLNDATSKDRSHCELMIVEGDSAGGSANAARDPKTQGVLPIRGKSLNVQKASEDKVLANQEFRSLVDAIGAGFGSTFDVRKSRYEKIILLSDADVDGSHIQILLLTFFYNYMKPLIEKGKVYIAMPPLYRATVGNKVQYLATDEEMKEFVKKNPKAEITRFKGLGEMDAKDLRETTVSKEHRTLQKVTIENAASAEKLIEDLMGKEVGPRKDFIFQNAEDIIIGN